MDPHAPYLPPRPFERVFYGGNEFDPENTSMEPVYQFKPFADFLKSWIPKGCTDQEYVTAQYDGAIAYMDACIQNIFASVEALGIEEETLIVITSDHGETLYEQTFTESQANALANFILQNAHGCASMGGALPSGS
jgi:arylsulfatase A-like enzyme